MTGWLIAAGLLAFQGALVWWLTIKFEREDRQKRPCDFPEKSTHP